MEQTERSLLTTSVSIKSDDKDTTFKGFLVQGILADSGSTVIGSFQLLPPPPKSPDDEGEGPSGDVAKLLDCFDGDNVIDFFIVSMFTAINLLKLYGLKQNAITHMSNEEKKSVSFLWIPPDKNFTGKVIFA